MTFLPHTHVALSWPAPPRKRQRRTATSVMAGDFDYRPQRDILTSLLNGAKPYHPPMSQEERQNKIEQRAKKRREAQEEKEREKERREAREQHRLQSKAARDEELHRSQSQGSSATGSGRAREDRVYSFWQALPPRPSAEMDPTPDPSDDDDDSSSPSSSKRPHTPYDEDELVDSDSRSLSPRTQPRKAATPPPRKVGRPRKKPRLDTAEQSVVSETSKAPSIPRQPKKRVAAKKGWKGWVEADDIELPRDKLIELDQAIILQDRRTRSGKNFDAIGEGKDTWV